MDEKINMLRQLGYSPEFIQAIFETDFSGSMQGENESSFETIDVAPIDFKELIIEKTEEPPSYIITSH